MAFQLLSVSTAVTLFSIIVVYIFVISRYLRTSEATPQATEKSDNQSDVASITCEFIKLSESLATALPDCVILPHGHNAAAFEQSMKAYWAQQECEVTPACVVRPRTVQQLCTAVAILKNEYDLHRGRWQANDEYEGSGIAQGIGLFAVRSGGHSAVPGAASIKGGIVIDLGLFCEINISEDGSSVVIGPGARWMDVSKVLDEKGLAVVGGRNSAVGVGGLTLGGGLSFYSPRFGFVCSNIIECEIVLASGAVTTASASTNPDLWRALKGGSNNFGVVTRFRARTFPATKIWSGFLYMPGFESANVLAGFHEFVNRGHPDNNKISTYDNNAAGPMPCFTYVGQLGLHIICLNLVYTMCRDDDEKKWPACWRTSRFPSLWRFWNTCKVRALTSATDEMNAVAPYGRRQVFATTTVQNDAATLAAAHAAYNEAITALRPANVKNLVWTLVLQPLLPEWARKGDANPLGLDKGTLEPLVIVSFTVNWALRRDDEVVKTATRRAVEQIDDFAMANNTAHPYRYLNYCAEWQKPFEGYGEDNLRFLQNVSGTYDPDGLFQNGCVGGFKLGMAGSEMKN